MRKNKAMSRGLAIITAVLMMFSTGNILTTFAEEAVPGTSYTQDDPAPGESDAPVTGDSNEPSVGESEEPIVGESDAPSVGESEAPVPGESDVPGQYPFKGMPEGYTLSEKQLNEKRAMNTNGTMKNFDTMKLGQDYVAGEIIFLTDSKDYAEKVAKAYNGELTSFVEGVAVVTLSGEATTYQAVSAAANPSTKLPAVYPNLIYRLDPKEKEKQPELTIDKSTLNYGINALGEKTPSLHTWAADRPNDPYLQSPNSYSQDEPFQWMHDIVGTYGAWGTTKGAGVTVAVLDTGTLTTHEDLAGRTLPLVSFVPDEAAADLDGHGTHVSGIIAATAGNGAGGAGIAPEATILPIKVLGEDGGHSDWIISGINYAASQHVSIINMSLGKYYYDYLLEVALNNAANAGVPTIVAASNDGSNVKTYPAGYPCVITVAATDQNGKRVYFSNWGAWVAVAAPGYDIWSSVADSDTSYDSYSGTSMAAPVVTGVAALYLSRFSGDGVRDINKDGLLNAKDVEALRAVLKKNVTKAASTQIGTGVINAQMMFNVAPPLPTFTVKTPDTDKIITDTKSPVPVGSLVEIAAEGNFIVYTTDNTNPTVANGIVTNGLVYSDAIVLREGKTTVKALAVNGAGNVGKVSSVTYTTYLVNVPVTSVTDIVGSSHVFAGKSAQYTAGVLPDNATNKKVLWSISAGSEKATLVNGKLTIKAKQTGTVTIRATSASNPDQYKEKTVNITPVVVGSITLVPSGLTKLVVGTNDTVMLATNILDTAKKPIAAGDVSLSYTSSNSAIATVDSEGLVTAKGSGTAKITCTALDGSGKSAYVNITVVVPVTGIANGGTYCVAAGKTVQLIAAVSPSGATNKKVTWSMDPQYSSLATLTSSGQLKAKTNVSGTVTVKAKVDECVAEFDIVVSPTAVTSVTLNTTKLTLFSKEVEHGDHPTAALITATTNPSQLVLWSSSNTKVATVNQDGQVNAVAKGTATITATAADGSGKKATCAVSVVNPVEAINITTTQTGIVGGKTLQLSAKCSPSTASSKVNWYVEDNEYLDVTSAGKITAKKGVTGTATVFAKATDGSNTIAEYDINVYQDAITSIKVLSMGGASTMFIEDISGADFTTSLDLSTDMVSSGMDYCNLVTWTSSNIKVATVDKDGIVTACGVGSATITATAQDGSGKKGTLAVKVTQPVKDIIINGLEDIPAGKKLKYTATVTPSKATNKAVDWAITSDTGGKATIKSDGTLTVAADISVDSIEITAKAKDGSNISAVKNITVRESPITSIKLTSEDAKATITSGKITKATLFTTNNITTSNYDMYSENEEKLLQLNAETNYPDAPLIYSSSNTKVAMVSSTGLVTAVGAGSTTITCAAADGGSIKATVPITVIVPMSYITIKPKSELTTYSNTIIATGTSRQFVATPGTTYGKPTNPAVAWDYWVLTEDFDIDFDKTSEFHSKGYVKISSSGLLTTSKALGNRVEYLLVIAEAKDGSGAYELEFVDLYPPTTYLQLAPNNQLKFPKDDSEHFIKIYTDNIADDYIITSSNPDVASCFVDDELKGYDIVNGNLRRYIYVYLLTPNKIGKSTIKIAVNDGTNKSTSFTVEVTP